MEGESEQASAVPLVNRSPLAMLVVAGWESERANGGHGGALTTPLQPGLNKPYLAKAARRRCLHWKPIGPLVLRFFFPVFFSFFFFVWSRFIN